jgi:hypothetical protein
METGAGDVAGNCRYHASRECWQQFGEITTDYLTRNDPDFLYQLAVDSYGAQHVGEATPNIGTAFSLIGLYLALECEYSGRRVQRAHMILAKRKRKWPRMESPSFAGTINVGEVLKETEGRRDRMLKVWGRSVWEAWIASHAWVVDAAQPLFDNR